MKINVAAISKHDRDCYSDICNHFIKMSKRYANIEVIELFNAKVTRAHENGIASSQEIYAHLFAPWMKKGYLIALDPAAKELDSENFASMMKNHAEITFFIGGAYGHAKEFLKKCDAKVSLSALTMSHKVAKVVLFEQIYRALTIQNNHPYHK